MSENLVKYPRTCHLPWSPGVSSDDRIILNLNAFIGNEIVITEKMDGENTTLSKTRCYARSVDSVSHESRTWVKQLWSDIAYQIPDSYRICGENLYAKHSILYQNLDSYFYGFSIWDNKKCLSWDDTLEWFALLNITSVPVLYRGAFDIDFIKNFDVNEDAQEGYVIRVAREFSMNEFSTCVAKYVRKGHVTSDDHWMHQQITLNGLKENVVLYGRNKDS